MYKMTSKAAALAVLLGCWAAQASAADLITLVSTDVSTPVGSVVTAQVGLTINEGFNLLTLDALLGYDRASLQFDASAPVYSGMSAQAFAASAPAGWVYNLDDPLGVSLSVVIDPDVLPAGLPVLVQPQAWLPLSFKGLTQGDHLVTFSMSIFDDASLMAGSVDAVAYATSFTVHVTAVPEPATYALMLGGLAAVGALARRRSRAA